MSQEEKLVTYEHLYRLFVLFRSFYLYDNVLILPIYIEVKNYGSIIFTTVLSVFEMK